MRVHDAGIHVREGDPPPRGVVTPDHRMENALVVRVDELVPWLESHGCADQAEYLRQAATSATAEV